MKVLDTTIEGVILLEPEPLRDGRGYFARTWCAESLAAHGCDARIAQCSVSYNEAAGTLRGMHWQEEPHGEAKTVSVSVGSIWDVVVDLRAGSPTYRRWFAAELSQANGRSLHIPAGCAHGFITLEVGAVVHYAISVPFVAEAARGFRWNDPTVAIEWPRPPLVLSQRDETLPFLESLAK